MWIEVNRRERIIAAVQVGLLSSAVVTAVLTSSARDWRPLPLLAVLACLAIGSHLFPFETGNVRICGSFMSMILAMTLLGPAPAVAIALTAVVVDTIRTRRSDHFMVLIDLGAFAVFPVVGGLLLSSIDQSVARPGAAYAVAV